MHSIVIEGESLHRRTEHIEIRVCVPENLVLKNPLGLIIIAAYIKNVLYITPLSH